MTMQRDPARKSRGAALVTRSCTRFLALAALPLAMACSTAGGGGAAVLSVGGPAGSVCNPQFHAEGCHTVQGQANQMTCDAATQKWVLKNACPAKFFCAETTDPAASPKKLTECKPIPQQPGTTDTVTGADTTTGGDTGVTDTTTGSDAKDPTPAEILTCVQNKCPSQWAACQAAPACQQAVNCLKSCKDEACLACLGPVMSEQVFTNLQACSDSQGCSPADTAECGDGICEAPETASTCAQDCKTTGPQCGNGTCESGETTTSCPADCKTTGPKCGNNVCEEGENIEMCPQDCKATGPVCGNGKCESGETSSNCAKDCTPTPTGKCGDGKCTSPETASSCVLDCDPKFASATACINQFCSSQVAACLNDTKCNQFLQCAANCKCNESCQQECASIIGTSPPPALMAFGECAGELDCPDPCPSTGPQCGNGTCEPGETSSSCPMDCGAKPVCGNGKCESGETSSNCPPDCAPKPTCGNGKCESGESPSSCPTDCSTGSFGCAGKCGQQSKEADGSGCYCDEACHDQNPPDCCSDKLTYCPKQNP